MAEFKIGDVVKVVVVGKYFSSYQSWVLKYAEKYLCEWVSSVAPQMNQKYRIVASGKHEWGSDILYLIRDEKERRVFIISEDGLELVKTSTTISSQKALQRVLNGEKLRRKDWGSGVYLAMIDNEISMSFLYRCMDSSNKKDILDPNAEWETYVPTPKSPPKFSEGDAFITEANDIGVILRDGKWETRDYLYTVTFNGRTTKEIKEGCMRKLKDTEVSA